MTQLAEVKNEVNGVDVDAMMEVIDAVTEQPALAEFKFRNSNQWLGGARNRSTIKDFYGTGEEHTERKVAYTYDNDEPECLLGTDNGANPAEYLLHALAGCMTTTIVYHAAAQGITVRRIESELEGDIDFQGFLGLREDVRPGFQDIRANFVIDADCSEQELQEILKRSVVCDTVCHPVRVNTRITLV